MTQLILPNLPRIALPERDALSGAEQKYGVELEGMVDLRPTFIRYQKELTGDLYDQHILLAQQIRDDAGLDAFITPSAHVWHIKDDCTIVSSTLNILGRCKAEIASPVLSGESGMSEIEVLYTYLDKIDFYTNRSCGMHVHVSREWGGHKKIRRYYFKK